MNEEQRENEEEKLEGDLNSQEIALNDTAGDIFSAISDGQIERVAELIKNRGQLLRIQNEKGQTPLHHAVSKNRLTIVKLLVKKGACVTTLDNDRRTPLCLALANKYVEFKIVNYFLVHDQKSKSKLLKTPESIKKYLKLARRRKKISKNKNFKKVISVLEDELKLKEENEKKKNVPVPSSPKTSNTQEISEASISTDNSISFAPTSMEEDEMNTSCDDSKSEDKSSILQNDSLKIAEDSSLEDPNKSFDEPYRKGGLSNSLAGVIYQMRLLILFVLRGIKIYDRFGLATEMEKAEKFDDVVFKYCEKDQSTNNKEMWSWRFMQAKHKRNPEGANADIKFSDLFPNVSNAKQNFSVAKYFVSYLKIRQSSEFPGKLSKFTICTNTKMNLNSTVPKPLKQCLNIDGDIFTEKKINNDPILIFGKQDFKAKCHQFSDHKQASKILNHFLLQYTQIILSDYKNGEYVTDKKIDFSRLSADNFKDDKEGLEKLKENVINKNLNREYLKANEDLFSNFYLYKTNKSGKNKGVRKKTTLCATFLALKNTEKDIEWCLDKINDALFNLGILEFVSTDSHDKEQIVEEFCKGFCLISEFYDEQRLGCLLKEEFNVKINLLNVDLAYSSLEVKMLDWLKSNTDGRGIFLTKCGYQYLVDSINKQINELITLGLGIAYPEQLKSYGVQYKVSIESYQELEQDISEFLGNKNKALKIKTNSRFLTAIKVLQCMNGEKCNKISQISGKVIFLELSTLMTDLKVTVIDSFKSERNFDILIIDCVGFVSNNPHNRQTFSNIYSDIDTIVTQSSKKVILISKSELQFVREFSAMVDSNTDDETLLSYLTPDSQNYILEKYIIFQGKRVPLDKILDSQSGNDVIDEVTLSQLVRDIHMKIGNSDQFLPTKTFNTEYYIPRQLFKKLQSLDESDFCLREQTDESDLYLREKIQKLVLISGPTGYGKSTLMSHLSFKIREIYPEFWIANINLNRFAPIESDFSLSKINEDGTVKETVNFFVDMIISKVNSNKAFGRKILSYGISPEREDVGHPKVILILDGYDEILEEYKRKILFALQILVKTKIVQIILTSDSYEVGKLDCELNKIMGGSQYIAYELHRFSGTDKIVFLEKYWKWIIRIKKIEKKGVKITKRVPLKIGKIKKIILEKYPAVDKSTWLKKLPDIISQEFDNSYLSGEKHFLDVPQHIFELGEISYQGSFENFQQLGFYRLFEKFVIKKLDIFHVIRANMQYGNRCIDRMVVKNNKDYYRIYSIIAANPCYQPEYLEYYGDMVAMGFLDNIEDSPTEISFNFSCYRHFFLAQYIYSNLCDENYPLFTQILTDNGYAVARKFLNDLLQENNEQTREKREVDLEKSEIWTSPNFEKFINILEYDMKENIILLAIQDNIDNIFKLIVQHFPCSDLSNIFLENPRICVPFASKSSKDIFEWTLDKIKHEFMQNCLEKNVKRMLLPNDNVNILECAIRNGNYNVAKCIVGWLKKNSLKDVLKLIFNCSKLIDAAVDTTANISDVEILKWVLSKIKELNSENFDLILRNIRKLLITGTEKDKAVKVTWLLDWIKSNTEDDSIIYVILSSDYKYFHWSLSNLALIQIKDLLNWIRNNTYKRHIPSNILTKWLKIDTNKSQSNFLNNLLLSTDEQKNNFLQKSLLLNKKNLFKGLIRWIGVNVSVLEENTVKRILLNKNIDNKDIFRIVLDGNIGNDEKTILHNMLFSVGKKYLGSAKYSALLKSVEAENAQSTTRDS